MYNVKLLKDDLYNVITCVLPVRGLKLAVCMVQVPKTIEYFFIKKN